MNNSEYKFNEESNKYVCLHCGKEYSKYGIKTHILRNYTEEGKKFDPNKGYKDGTRKGWNKGLTKESDERVKMCGETYKNRVKDGEIIPPQTGRPLSEEHKKKISESMKIAHKEYRAHNIGECRWKCEPSYPEQFFYRGNKK